MGETKYGADSSAKDILEALQRRNACGEAISYHARPSIKTARDMAENTPNQGWAVWALQTFREKNSLEVRTILISKITDPMMAFMLYLDLDFWTDEEDKLLEEKFKGKLPTAESELEKGIVTRAKDGSNRI